MVYRPIQRLRIDRVAASHCKSIDFIGAIELRGTRTAATPPAERGPHNGAACGIHGDYMRAENASNSRWRRRQSQRIRRRNPSAGRSGVYGIPGTGIENAEPPAVVI